jgi:hypothetical protein
MGSEEKESERRSPWRPKYFEDDRKGVPPERRPFITALAELIVADLLRRPPRKGEEK